VRRRITDGRDIAFVAILEDIGRRSPFTTESKKVLYALFFLNHGIKIT
jgi:hypothetical protein